MTQQNTTTMLRILSRWLLREEWRLYSRAASGKKMFFFPVLAALLAAGGGLLGNHLGLTVDWVVSTAFMFVFLAGLHVGFIGLVKRDIIDDMMGDTVYLLRATSTLPVDIRTVIGLYILTETLFYTALLVVPIGIGISAVHTTLPIAIFIASLVLMFFFGMVAALIATTIMLRQLWSLVVLSVVGALIGIWAFMGNDILTLIPYGIYLEQSPLALAANISFLAITFFVSVLFLDPNANTNFRELGDQYSSLRNGVMGNRPIAIKTLLEVHRTRGGLLKLLLSFILLFAVSFYLILGVEAQTRMIPHGGVSMATLLSLSTFLSYMWFVGFDSSSEYSFFPITAQRIFYEKAIALLLTSVPLAMAHYLLGAHLLGVTLLDGVLGAILLVSLMTYLFGMTMSVAGMTPSLILRSPKRGGLLIMGIVTVIVPLLYVGLAAPLITDEIIIFYLGYSAFTFGIGVALFRSARRYWA